jgi:hypothetical protein
LLDVAALVDFIYRGRVDPLNGIEYEISLNITPDTIILEIIRPEDIFRLENKLPIQHALSQSACRYSTATTNHLGCRVVVHFAMITDQLVMSFLHVIEVIVEDHDIAAAAHLSDSILL